MALGGGSLAGVARVAFETTGVGETKRDIDSVERSYRSSLDNMSDGAIKLQLAEDRLQRAVKRGPGNYNAVARAELGVRRARADLRVETDRLDRSEDRRNRNLGGMKRSLAAYTAGYVGTTGLILAIRSSLAASREEEVVLGQTRVALESTGLSWGKYEQRIQSVIKAQSALGFDDEKLLQTFSTFVRRTKDVDEALKLNALSADLARGRYIDLEAASLLVLKASLGQAGALRRVGIDAEKGASGVELLRKLTESYGQSAEKASMTGIAAQDRLNVAIENTKEAIGRGLLPTVTEYTDKLTKWLDTAEHQEELQRKVNAAVETGASAIGGVVDALKLVKQFGDPVIDVLGGMENTLRALTLLWVGFKVKAALGFSQTALSSGATSKAMIAHAGAAGRAWDIATRPRNLVVTTTTTGVPGGGRGGGGRGVPPVVPVPPDPRTRRRGGGLIGTGIGIITAILGPEILERAPNERGQAGPNDMAKFRQWAKAGRLTHEQVDQLDNFLLSADQARELHGIVRRRDPVESAVTRTERSRRRSTRDIEQQGERRQQQQRAQGRERRTFSFADVERGFTGFAERDIDVQTTEGTSDDAKLARDRLALANRALRELKLTRDQRLRVKQERLNALQELGRIEQDEEQAARAIRDKAQAARAAASDKRRAAHEKEVAAARKEREAAKKREEARQRAEERESDQFERRTRARDMRRNRGRDPLSGFGGGLGSALSEAKKGRGKGAGGENGLTEAEVTAMTGRVIGNFLSQWEAQQRNFANNFQGSGFGGERAGTELYVQTNLLRDQNAMIGKLVGETSAVEHVTAKRAVLASSEGE